MFTADYGHLKQGKSLDEPHHVIIHVDDAKLIPERFFREVFPSGLAGHAYPPFDREHNLYVTFQRLMFRPSKQTATLTVSDWKDDDPGGAIGRELTHNFIEVQPYLEDAPVPNRQDKLSVPQKRAGPSPAPVPRASCLPLKYRRLPAWLRSAAGILPATPPGWRRHTSVGFQPAADYLPSWKSNVSLPAAMRYPFPRPAFSVYQNHISLPRRMPDDG